MSSPGGQVRGSIASCSPGCEATTNPIAFRVPALGTHRRQIVISKPRQIPYYVFLQQQFPHIVAFFAQYPRVSYKPSQPIWNQFEEMCDLHDWDDYEKRKARRDLKDAMVQDFNLMYGTDVGDLPWKGLCQACGVTPAQEDLAGYRKALRSTHVNIVDLLECKASGRSVRLFPSAKALSDYTIETKKYFPKKNAYAGGLLRSLLCDIVSPSAKTRGSPSVG